MFTLPHIYVATKVAKSHHPLLVLGSFLPDIGLLSKTEAEKDFSWNQLHEGGDQIINYAKKFNPKFIPLGLGVVSHGVTYGLDKYSDRVYKGKPPGYAKEKANPLYESVIECCKVSQEIGEVFAHNFIEMAVNLLVAKKYPRTIKDLKIAGREIDQNEVTSFLSGCFRVNKKMILNLTENLFKVFNPNDLISANGLAKIWAKVALRLEGVNIDKEKTSKVIQRGVKLVKPDYEIFLQDSIQEMQRVMK